MPTETRKTSFDATTLGIIANTFLGLPKAALEVGKDIGRSIAQNIGSAGVTLTKPITGSEEVAFDNFKSLFGQELFRNVFGDQPIRAVEDRIATAELNIKNNEFAQKIGADKIALPLAFGGIIGSVALDLTPFGALEKNATKAILKETTETGALQIAKKLGADDQVAKMIAPIFASTKTEKEAEKSLELFKSLLGTKEGLRKSAVRPEAISPELEPLAQEARKYKSAEEFVEAQLDKEFGTAKESVEDFIQRVKTKRGANIAVGESAGDIEGALKSIGISAQNDVAGGLAFQKIKKAGTSFEEDLQTLYNHFAQKEGKAFAQSVSFGTDPDNPIKGARIILERGSEGGVDVSILGRAKQILGDILEESKKIDLDLADETVRFQQRESQLTDFYNKAVSGVPRPAKSADRKLAKETALSLRATKTLQKEAQETLVKANQGGDTGAFSLQRSIETAPTPVNKKVNILDYVRTPDRVLAKIGLKEESDFLRKQYDAYIKELPENISKITEWSKQVPSESNQRLFHWLDGQDITLTSTELKVGNEIKVWLKEWADRLHLPEDNRIAEYITHIFDDQLLKKEFDEDLAKIIADKIPSSVYNPFLQERLGAKGYVEDTWKALDAYVKRATRKVHIDPALERIYEKSKGLEKSQWDYVKQYTDRVNLRPTDLDTLLDNGVKNLIGFRFGQRPTTAITRFLRQMTYRAFLGGNVSSALKNLSQGINTYAKLGEKYTVIGYTKLFSSQAREELVREGVLRHGFIQDRTLTAAKRVIEKIDKGLFFFFETAERINRGAAYWGAKAKALAQGKTEIEAIDFAKKMVRDTQFSFGSIDTPAVLQSDIGKTIGQFQSFTIKQIEFLTEMAMQKEFAGLMRYAVSGLAFVYTIGKAFGMEPKDLIPAWRIGTPPSLKAPIELGKAVLGTPDKYGRERDTKTKAGDVAKSLLGLVPAGIQIKKTVQGIEAVRKGKSETRTGKKQFEVGGTPLKDIQAVIFGKYANPEAKAYFNPKKKTTLTF